MDVHMVYVCADIFVLRYLDNLFMFCFNALDIHYIYG